jgi:formylglycine-generating enzyme required for sulfatase activity/tRNA A-37 threonylcarbamoyl transferase component Bud32/ribosomal protein L40E
MDALDAAEKRVLDIVPGFRPGQKLGHYVIESMLGSGGMAVVFKGTQLSLNRSVAIKVLPQKFLKKQIFLDRFESEATVLANLNHPNIVSVIDRGSEHDTYFIVMEYIEGETLKEILTRERKLDSARCAKIATQVLTGLGYAHKRRVVHRDIKPGNIMINMEHDVRIADFGLAHLAKEEGGLDITRENQSMGTVKYMAPEQLTSAKDVDGRADIYSFAVVLYEMLTGNLPLGTFKMPSEVDAKLDVRWDDVILKALRMDPDERYAAAEDMAAVIREIATTRVVTAEEREQEEEESLVQKVAVSRVACAECGHESGVSATSCEKCNADLSDLFDVCAGCRAHNRVDVSPCPKCGHDLASERAEVRRKAENLQRRAMALRKKRDFDGAVSLLQKLLKLKAREYAPVRQSAIIWIKRLQERRNHLQERAYEAGIRLMAEKRFEAAIQVWEPLPDDYRDIGVQRKGVMARRDQARGAFKAGRTAFNKGDFAGAVRLLDKAHSFWPHNKEVHDALIRAKNKHGNLNLRVQYLADARDARAKGDLDQTRDLCRKLLAMEPGDESALALLGEVGSDLSEGVDYSQELFVPDYARNRPKRDMSKGLIIGVVVGMAVIGTLILIFGIIRPARARARETAARDLLSLVEAAYDDQSYNKALGLVRQIERDHASSRSVDRAREIAVEIEGLLERAGKKVDAADAIAASGEPGSMVAALKAYSLAAADPDVQRMSERHEYVKAQREKSRLAVAMQLHKQGKALEEKLRWREAVAVYERAKKEFAYEGEPITSALKAARKVVLSLDTILAQARKAAAMEDWVASATACRTLMDMAPHEDHARLLLIKIAPKLTPPNGMVYVPPGTYSVGGTEDNPKRDVTFPLGYYIGGTEVSCSRYAAFLKATGRPAPPGWGADGTPPEGADDLPVTNLTWPEAQAFAIYEKAFLPTEAQWEAAVGGKSAHPYPWGMEWKPLGVTGGGAMNVAFARGDRSPFGALGLAGNVSEWIAGELVVEEPIDAPGITASERLRLRGRKPKQPLPKRLFYRIAKGNSWAGIEKDRVMRIVPAAKVTDGGYENGTVLLVADDDNPQIALGEARHIQVFYLGAQPTAEYAAVAIRMWVADLGAWVVVKTDFKVARGTPIRKRATVRVSASSAEMPGGGEAKPDERVSIDFETHCILLDHKPGEWMLIRDGFGTERKILILKGRIDKTKTIVKGQPDSRYGVANKTLAETSARTVRLVSPMGKRYLNVGFRCVKKLYVPPGQRNRTMPPPPTPKTKPAEKPDADGEPEEK